MIKNSQKGVVLIIGLIFVFLTAVLVAGILLITDIENRNVVRDQWSLTAFHLAEAGVEDAIWALNNSDWGGGWTTPTGGPYTKTVSSFTDSTGKVIGSYYVTVTDPTSTTPDIESTGYSPSNTASDNIERTVKIALQNQSIFTRAIFGDEWIKMKGNAKTDSYNSSLGSYASTKGNNGHVGTNSTSTSSPYAIHLENNAEVDGNAAIGPSGDTNNAIELENNADITGTPSANSSLVEMPSISAPDMSGTTYQGSINLSGNDSASITGDSEYSSITLDSNSDLTIDPGVSKIYVTGNLTLDSNTEINISSSGSLTIYVAGQININSNSEINIGTASDLTIYVGQYFHMDSNSKINNDSQDPTKFSLLALDSLTDPGDPNTNPGIDINSNSNLYGSIYAKNAGILMNSNADVYGAVVANTIRLDSNAKIHYDQALATDSGSPGAGVIISYWKEQ
ncbi:MAG: hypothetical protein ISS46_03020 [Candidatus Omnitrophica bacterium]|nr:hypothetical protein [Candidatus Omnitrophota bacterium]